MGAESPPFLIRKGSIKLHCLSFWQTEFLFRIIPNEVRNLHYWNEGFTPFPTFPQRQKEKWFSYLVASSKARHLLILERELRPFLTDRILVVLSVAKDLLLISPKKTFYYVVPRALARGISAVHFSGGVRGGDFSLLHWLRRVFSPHWIRVPLKAGHRFRLWCWNRYLVRF